MTNSLTDTDWFDTEWLDVEWFNTELARPGDLNTAASLTPKISSHHTVVTAALRHANNDRRLNNEGPSVTQSEPASPVQSSRIRTRVRPTRTTSAIKKPRKLPRAEIIRLRNEVETLTARLDALQQTRHHRRTSSLDEMTFVQTPIQLHEATVLNQRLRRQVAHQMQLQMSMEALLQSLHVDSSILQSGDAV